MPWAVTRRLAARTGPGIVTSPARWYTGRCSSGPSSASTGSIQDATHSSALSTAETLVPFPSDVGGHRLAFAECDLEDLGDVGRQVEGHLVAHGLGHVVEIGAVALGQDDLGQ